MNIREKAILFFRRSNEIKPTSENTVKANIARWGKCSIEVNQVENIEEYHIPEVTEVTSVENN